MKFVIALSCALAMIVGANSQTNVIERIRKSEFKDPRSLFVTEEKFDFDKMADEDDHIVTKKVNKNDFDSMADEDDKTETKKVNNFDFDSMADQDDASSLKFLSS